MNKRGITLRNVLSCAKYKRNTMRVGTRRMKNLFAFKRVMAFALAMVIFFSDSMIVNAAESINGSLAVSNSELSDNEVWSFVESTGYGSESNLPAYLKDESYKAYKEMTPRIRGNGNKTATIKWNPVAGASSYEFALIDDSRNKYEQICYQVVNNATGCTFNLEKPALGPYYLRIRAYDSNKKELKSINFVKVYFPNHLNEIKDLPEPSAIETDRTDTQVTIRFKEVANAMDYTILFDGKEYLINSRPSASGWHETTFKNLEPNKEYSFSIRANLSSKIGQYTTILPKFDYKSIPGTYGETRKIATTQKSLDRVKITSKSATENTVSVVWNTVVNASAYDLCIDDKKYTTTDNQKTVTGLTPGKTYKVYVVAKNAYTSTQSETVDIKTPPQSPKNSTVVSTDTTAVISWDFVEGADKYEVAYYVDGKENTISCPASSNPSVLLAGLSADKSYSYKIRCQSVDGNGEYSSLKSFKTQGTRQITNAPQIKSLYVEEGKLYLSWSETEKATEYEIDISGKKYYSDGTSYCADDLTPGKTYQVAVCGKNEYGSGTFSSDKRVIMPPEVTIPLDYLVSENSIELFWKCSFGATGYVITFDGIQKEYSSSSTSAKYTGLKEATGYNASIACKNEYGTGKTVRFGNIVTLATKKYPCPTITDKHIVGKNGLVQWASVDGAIAYDFEVDGKVSRTNSLAYYIPAVMGKTVRFRVRAVGKTWVGEYSPYYTIKFPPAHPRITNATSTFNSVTLFWNSVPGAEGYIINGKYHVNANQTSYTITGLMADSDYYYSVFCESTDGYCSLEDNEEIKVRTKQVSLSVPTGVTAQADDKSFTVTWNPVANAENYTVVIDNLSVTVKGTKRTFTGLKPETKYTYKVRANAAGTSGPYSAEKTIYTTLPAPQNVRAYQYGTGDVTICWLPDYKASGYQVWINGKTETLPAGSNSYVIEDAHGETINYKVRSISSKGVYSCYSAEQTIIPYPEKISGIKTQAGTNSVDISWNPSRGATSYTVISNNLRTTTTDTHIHIDKLMSGFNYYFYVFATNANGMRQGEDMFYVRTKLLPPIVSKTVSSQNRITIYWNGASYETEKYEVIFDGVSYEVKSYYKEFTNLEADTKHTYKIRSIYGDDKSAFTEEAEVYTAPLPPAAPENLSAKVLDKEVELVWDAVPGVDSYKISIGTNTYISEKPCARVVGLTPNTTYAVKVCAVKRNVVGNYSESISFRTLLETPNIKNIDMRGRHIDISIMPVAGANEYLYKVGGNEYITKSTSVSVDGVLPFTEYEYEIYAKNDSVSGAINKGTFTTDGLVPRIPDNIWATSTKDSVDVKWIGVDGATDYDIIFDGELYHVENAEKGERVEEVESDFPVKKETVVSLFKNVVSSLFSLNRNEKAYSESTLSIGEVEKTEYLELSKTFCGLLPETEYEYKIRANNAFGSSEYSSGSIVKTQERKETIQNSIYDYQNNEPIKTYLDGCKNYTIGDPIDSVTGAFLWSNTLVEDFGADNLHFDILYKSQADASAVRNLRDIGKAWTHSFDYSLRVDGGIAYFTTPYEATISFVADGGKFVNSEGDVENTTLVRNENGYSVSLADGSSYEFDNNQRLSGIKQDGVYVYFFHWDESKNTMKISTKRSSWIEMKYSHGQIANVRDSLGNEVSLKYQNGYLVSVLSAESSEMKFEYDDYGRIIRIIGYDGLPFLENTYDERGRVIHQRLQESGTIDAVYDDENRVNRFCDVMGNVTAYMYDECGRIVCLEKDDKCFINEYNELGQLVKQIDAEGNETITDYDKRGRICKIAYPDGTTEETRFDDEDKPIEVIDRSGNKIFYEYDDHGRIKQSIDKNGNISEYYYDIHGNIITYVDNLGNEWNYEYDIYSHLQKEIDPEGNVAEYSYDRAGRLLTYTDSKDFTTRYEYSPSGHLLSVIEGDKKTFYSYDSNGNVISVQDQNGNEESFEYDASGNVIKKIDAEGNAYYYLYDDFGNLSCIMYPDGWTEKYSYDSSGNMLSYKDKNENYYDYTYDKNGNLISMTNPLGEHTRYEYDSMGRVSLVEDSLGRITRYTYTLDGRMASCTDPANNIVSYAYDANGNLVSQIDEEGHIVSFEYDQNNRIVSVSDAGGKEITTYDKVGNVISVEDRNGYVERYSYDSEGNVVEFIDKGNNRWKYEYDKKGRLVKEIDPVLATTKYDYDVNDNCISVTDAEGNTVTYEYNRNNQIVKVTDKAGYSTSYLYDVMGNISEVIDKKGNSTKMYYDGEGNLLSKINAVGGCESFSYDELNRCIRREDEEGNVWTYTYDEVGNKASCTDPNGNIVKYEYDGNNRLIREVNQNSDSIEYDYTKTGLIHSIKDEEGTVTSFEYDDFGRVVKMYNANGDCTSYTYDGNDNVLSKTDAKGNIYRYSYSPKGDLVSETDPEGNTTNYSYNSVGLIISKKDANGNETKYEYDKLRQPIVIIDPLGNKTEYTYSNTGKISRVTDAYGDATNYYYDACDNLVKMSDPVGNAICYEYDAMDNCIKQYASTGDDILCLSSYEYDKKGRCIKEINPLSYVKTYRYDGNDNVVEIKDEEGKETKVTYDYNNNPISKTFGDGSQASYKYNKRGELVILNDWTGDTSFERNSLGDIVSVKEPDGNTLGYEYDSVGNIIQIRYPDGEVLSYGYDKNNRILTVSEGNQIIGEYEYDGVGNVIKISSPDSYQRYEYNANNLPIEITNVIKDEIESTTSYRYDNIGRIVEANEDGKSSGNYNRVKYTYDVNGQVVKIESNEKSEEYVYDSVGNRIEKVTNGQDVATYSYNESNQLISKCEDGHMYQYEYDKCGNLLLEKKDDTAIIEYEYGLNDRLVLGKNLEKNQETQYTYNALGMMVGNAQIYINESQTDLYPEIDNILPVIEEPKIDPIAPIIEEPESVEPIVEEVSSIPDEIGLCVSDNDVQEPNINNNLGGAETEYEDISEEYSNPELSDADITPVESLIVEIEEEQEEITSKNKTEILTIRYVNDYLSKTSNPLYEISGENETSRYVYGRDYQLLSVNRNGKRAFVTTDAYMTPIGEVDSEGNYEAYPKTDVWGNINQNEYYSKWFTSYHYDPVVDKYFAKARFYDAKNGRMISLDPVKRGINLYCYCGNDPVNKVDSDGEIAEWLIPGVTKALVQGTFGIVESYISQADSSKSFKEKTKNALAHGLNEGIKGFASGATLLTSRTVPGMLINSVAGAAGDALEQYITTGKVDVTSTLKAAAKNTIREAIYGGDDLLDSLKKAVVKGAASKAADSAIDYSTDALLYNLSENANSGYIKGTSLDYDKHYNPVYACKSTDQFDVSFGNLEGRGYNAEDDSPYSINGFLRYTAQGALEGAAESAVFYGVDKALGAAKDAYTARKIAQEQSNAKMKLNLQFFADNGSSYSGTGEYGNVGGHHVHAKAAFKGNVNYDPNKGFSISQEFMENNGLSHQKMTSKQRELFKELFESGRPNTLEEHTRIAREALRAGGADDTMINTLINDSLSNLGKQGVTSPSRIPWYLK